MSRTQNNTSRHRKLKDKLISLIGTASINDKLPPERKLAEKYQVCRATVNKVMVELEKEGYVIRRVGKGTFIAPRDKAVVSAFDNSPRTSGNIVVAYPDFFSYLLWERVHYAELHGLRNNINIINVKLQPESTMQSIVKIIENTPDILGVVLLKSTDSIPKATFNKLDSFGLPVVITGSQSPNGIFRNIYSVKNDHYQSGYLKMHHLLEKGHRDIGLVPNEPATVVSNEHLKGVKQALYDHGMRWKDVFLPGTRPVFWDDPLQAGYEQTRYLLDKYDLTALLYDTIRGTFGGLRAIYEAKLKCPDDISVITALTHFGMEKMTSPALSTVVTDNEEVIKTAFDIILNNNATTNKNYIIDVKLIERESVRQL